MELIHIKKTKFREGKFKTTLHRAGGGAKTGCSFSVKEEGEAGELVPRDGLRLRKNNGWGGGLSGGEKGGGGHKKKKKKNKKKNKQVFFVQVSLKIRICRGKGPGMGGDGSDLSYKEACSY